MAETNQDKAPDLPRAVLLLLWLVLANVWSTRHLGFGFDHLSATLTASGVAVVFGLFKAAGLDYKVRLIAVALQRLTSPRTLAALFVVLAAAASVWSSVVVLNDPPGSSLKVTLIQADGTRDGETLDNVSDPKTPVAFRGVRTNPLGVTYWLKVAGYQPQTVEVFPLLGVTRSPRRDLRINPSVLFRPPAGALATMTGFKVEIEGSPPSIVAKEDKIEPTSFIIGTEQQISPELISSWTIEATAQGFDKEGLAKTLEFWMKPKVVTPARPIEPGWVLVATIHGASGEPLAQARLRVTEARFQIAAMTEVPE